MIELNNMDEGVQQKLLAVFAYNKPINYEKGEFLLRAHEQPQQVFFITKGTVRLYGLSKNGSELVLHLFKPYSFFPLTWAINNAPNVYYYEAMTPVEVHKVQKDKFLDYLKGNPDILFDMLARAYRGIDGILAKMLYQMIGSAYGKVLSEILIYAKRFGETYYENGTAMMRVIISERDLAAQSGLTRETVSREIRILKDKGILTYSKNNLTIFDFERLEHELSEIT